MHINDHCMYMYKSGAAAAILPLRLLLKTSMMRKILKLTYAFAGPAYEGQAGLA